MKRTWTFISLACLKFIDYRLISLIKIEVLKPIKNYLCKQRWSQPSFFINPLFLLKWAVAHLCPLSGVRFREQGAVRHPGAASTCCRLAVWSLETSSANLLAHITPASWNPRKTGRGSGLCAKCGVLAQSRSHRQPCSSELFNVFFCMNPYLLPISSFFSP